MKMAYQAILTVLTGISQYFTNFITIKRKHNITSVKDLINIPIFTRLGVYKAWHH